MTRDWDQYWAAQLADESSSLGHRTGSGTSLLLHHIENLGNPPAWRSVLVVGCGISTESAALAYTGYEVVAFDLSQVAVAHVRSQAATPVELAGWFGLTEHMKSAAAYQEYLRNGHDPIEVRRVLAARQRKGGSLVTLRSDFRDFASDRRFDIVYLPFIWSCLVDDDRPELARRAHVARAWWNVFPPYLGCA